MPLPNKIKYSTSPTEGTIKVGSFLLGVTDGVTYGPTSVTGFYQGLSPLGQLYTVYKNKATLGPAIFRPNTNSEFITLSRALGGVNVTGVTDGLVYLKSQSDIVVVNKDYVDTTTNKLSICLDPSFVPSYPTSGTTFYNIGNNNNPLTFSLVNGVSYSSDAGGSLVFDGVDDEVSSNTFYTMSSGMTWDIWVKRTSDGNIFNMMMSNAGIPYMAFRGTGSGGNANRYQVAWNSKSGVTTTQRNLYTTGSTYNNNTWYNFTYTLLYDLQNQTSTGKIYVNGILNTEASYFSDSVYQPSGGKLILGNYSSNQYPFPGNIGRFLVYDRVLTDAEILNNYNKAKIPYLVSAFQTSIVNDAGVYEAQSSQINILQDLNNI